jgi:uracil-DNA glycosylase
MLDERTRTISWQAFLEKEKKAPYFQKLLSFLTAERLNKTIYPPEEDVFNALKLTPFETVKVVIIGQDPYHGPNQAMGLSFSVREGLKKPPSLNNIFKALKKDLALSPPEHGSLEAWARQGVLLLNATLTVEAHKAVDFSHRMPPVQNMAIFLSLSFFKEHFSFANQLAWF